MVFVYIGGGILFLLLCALAITYVCYRIAFYVPPRKPGTDALVIPNGEIYEAHREVMEKWVKEARAMPHEEVSITSFDGLTLYANYFEYAPGAPIELMLHGYRGNAERDLSGGVQRCFRVGRSALVVDQRCSGKSGGHTITFGVHEHKDCLAWIDFMVQRFGPDVKIILTGISMGAATVLMAGGKELPPNVIGILADCGYSSTKAIIKEVIRTLHLPVGLSYFFVKLGARLFGRFDLEEDSPENLLKNCKVPVIFFHGDTDALVPCYMSQVNYDACPGKKRLVTIPGAGHGLAYLVDPETYVTELLDFFGPEASAKL